MVEISEPFLAKGIRFVADGYDAQFIRDTLERDTTRIDERRGGRRALLLGGAAAATAMLAQRRTASAANGQPILMGQANGATDGTTVVADTGTYAFTAQATTSYGFGVRGIGTAYGVYGEGATYAGVHGDASPSGVTGVSGLSRASVGRGAGVSGVSQSTEGIGVAGY